MKLKVVAAAHRRTIADLSESAAEGSGKSRWDRTVPVICSEAALTQHYFKKLRQSCQPQHVPVTRNLLELHRYLTSHNPPVVLLDESVVGTGHSIEPIVGMLTEVAPVVVVAAAERQEELAFFITSGAVDFVARNANFVPIAAGLIERRIMLAEGAAGLFAYSDEGTSEDFGEILRHEVNNPLTGILGNAELLLARRDRLPSGDAAKVETIAELAVRLRETVRRLSSAWMLRGRLGSG